MNNQLAVLGCGYWGKNLVRNFHQLGALALVCDPSEASRAIAQQTAPGVPVADRFEQALSEASISAVAIAAPAVLHHSLVQAALEAGKDVYVEKPLCLEITQAEELVNRAEALGRVLMVGHLLQYHPCIERLKVLIAQGELGKLYYITSNRLNLGKIRREENALWSFAPHDISVILSLAGNQLPEQVRCTGAAYLNTGVADTTLTTLRFASNVLAHIYVSWLNPFKEQKLTVVGSNGMAVFDDTRPWPEKLVFHRQYITWKEGQIPTPNKSTSELIIVPEAEPLRQECQHFLDCCRDRRTPRTDGQEGLRVLRVLQAAQQSLEQDGEAAVPEVRHQKSEVIVQKIDLRPPTSDVFVHPTAVVDNGAVLGQGTKVWHFSHIMKGARIGERCIFGQNVNVDGGTVVGNNVKVQNNVSIYTGTLIEDDVFLGPSCVLTNVTNPRSQVNRRKLYETTVIKRGATVGANATIVCGVTIGRYAFIGAGAVVTKDVPDYALVMGNPARHKGWMSRHGHGLKHPDKDGIMVCPESGYRYRLEKSEIRNPKSEIGILRCLDLDEEAPLPLEKSMGVKSYDELKIQNA